MAVTDKGLDPIEAQGDGQPVSGKGVYVHDGSGNFLEALNQPQADGFLRMGFRLATPEEATKYQKTVLAGKEEANELNPVVEARKANPTEEAAELMAAAFQRALENGQPKPQELPKAVDEVSFDDKVEELSGVKQETKEDTKKELKK